MKYIPYLILVSILGLMSTNQNTDNTIYHNKKHLSFDKYWYDGKAEISSYKLKQGRYGEIHRGTASLIFVTEPFSPQRFVKPYQENK